MDPIPQGLRSRACIVREIDDAKGAPLRFTCTSGELLWGQLHTVIAGAGTTKVDTAEGPQGHTTGFCYRAAARKGEWKVEAAILNIDGVARHVGFVYHHAEVDGVAILRRAAEVGIYGNGKEVVFVNRYEWSGSSSPGCESIVEAVEGKVVDPDEDDFDGEKYYRSLVHGRCILVDSQEFPALLQALKDGKRLERSNYVFEKKGGEELGLGLGFGVQVVVEDSEYDMGWMVFQEGKLVGFVYDGAYSALEGDIVQIGDTLVAPQ